ncbi:MAG TPA: hypothetical protein VLA04_02605 [Verrucomicrobiae bacterium]|nr:hypothetical protein [Verrucomicrobiae bacterium]
MSSSNNSSSSYWWLWFIVFIAICNSNNSSTSNSHTTRSGSSAYGDSYQSTYDSGLSLDELSAGEGGWISADDVVVDTEKRFWVKTTAQVYSEHTYQWPVRLVRHADCWTLSNEDSLSTYLPQVSAEYLDPESLVRVKDARGFTLE